MPSSSWISAMVSTVATTSSASRTPGISGSCTGGLLRWGQRSGGLGGVHDEALADHGVERVLDETDGARRVGDVPRQEAMVEPGQRVLIVVDADRALQPPVRRVQGVGVVGAGDVKAGRRHAVGKDCCL